MLRPLNPPAETPMPPAYVDPEDRFDCGVHLTTKETASLWASVVAIVFIACGLAMVARVAWLFLTGAAP
jgi:hypothetical protein